MTTGMMAMSNNNGGDRAEQALRWIGDLDHPFYDDERQRFVWYEAASIGFQAVLIAQYLAIALVMLIGGLDSLVWALILAAPMMIGVVAVQWYSRRHKAPYVVTRTDFARPRGRLAVFLGALYMAGVIRVALDARSVGDGGDGFFGGFSGGFSSGALVGVAVGVVAIGVSMFRDRNKSSDALLDDD